MKKRNLIGTSVVLLVFLLSIITCSSLLLVPRVAYADNNPYLLDRVIQWPDGTTEQVQMDSEGYFILDGTKRRLVGMCLSTTFMPYGESGEFYLPRRIWRFMKMSYPTSNL